MARSGSSSAPLCLLSSWWETFRTSRSICYNYSVTCDRDFTRRIKLFGYKCRCTPNPP